LLNSLFAGLPLDVSLPWRLPPIFDACYFFFEFCLLGVDVYLDRSHGWEVSSEENNELAKTSKQEGTKLMEEKS